MEFDLYNSPLSSVEDDEDEQISKSKQQKQLGVEDTISFKLKLIDTYKQQLKATTKTYLLSKGKLVLSATSTLD